MSPCGAGTIANCAWAANAVRSPAQIAPRRSPDFAWAFGSRFLFVLAYALLITYQAYFLVDQLGQDEADVAGLIFQAAAASPPLRGSTSRRWPRP